MVNILCENCLSDGAKPVDIGPELGSQRDPYQDKLQLCAPCKDALLKHDFYTLQSRFTLERHITNGRKK